MLTFIDDVSASLWLRPNEFLLPELVLHPALFSTSIVQVRQQINLLQVGGGSGELFLPIIFRDNSTLTLSLYNHLEIVHGTVTTPHHLNIVLVLSSTGYVYYDHSRSSPQHQHSYRTYVSLNKLSASSVRDRISWQGVEASNVILEMSALIDALRYQSVANEIQLSLNENRDADFRSLWSIVSTNPWFSNSAQFLAQLDRYVHSDDYYSPNSSMPVIDPTVALMPTCMSRRKHNMLTVESGLIAPPIQFPHSFFGEVSPTGGGTVRCRESQVSKQLLSQQWSPPFCLTSPAGPLWNDSQVEKITADFDGDGLTDILIFSVLDHPIFPCERGTAAVHLSLGDGHFGNTICTSIHAMTDADTTKVPHHKVHAGDVNGDGMADIVTQTHFSLGTRWNDCGRGTGGVYLSRGDGTFSGVQCFDFDVSSNYVDLLVLDVTGDGKADLIRHNRYPTTITSYPESTYYVNTPQDCHNSTFGVYVSQGNGRFFPAVCFPSQQSSRDTRMHTEIASIRANADNYVDLLVYNNRDDVECATRARTYLSQGDGTFVKGDCILDNPWGPIIMDPIVSDINGDGIDDIVERKYGTRSFNPGSNGPQPYFGCIRFGPDYKTRQKCIQLPNGYLYEILPIDVNGDGASDLVFWSVQVNGNNKPKICEDGSFGVLLSPSPIPFLQKPASVLWEEWAYFAQQSIQCIPMLSVSRSSSTKFQLLSGDFNGDCRMDLLFVAINKPTDFECSSESGVLLSRFGLASVSYNTDHVGCVSGSTSNSDVDPNLVGPQSSTQSHPSGIAIFGIIATVLFGILLLGGIIAFVLGYRCLRTTSVQRTMDTVVQSV